MCVIFFQQNTLIPRQDPKPTIFFSRNSFQVKPMLFLFSFQLQQQQNLLVDQGPKRFMDRAPAFRHPVEDQDSIGIFFCAFLLPRSHHESGDGEWLRDARWGCIWRACRWPLRPSALSLRGQADTLAACYVRCHSGRKYKGRCVLICMHERSLHFRPDW